MTGTLIGWLALTALLTALGALLAYRAGSRTAAVQLAGVEGQRDALAEQLRTRGSLDETLQPLQRAMSDLSGRVQSAERARAGEISGLSERMLAVGREVTEATRDVHQQAARITEALSRTHRQGTWGEMQLRRLVEASGMLSHVHFVEQLSLEDDGRLLRPDMVVDIGAGRQVVVDAKVSLDAFLDPDLDDGTRAQVHAAAVADHVQRLAGKQYWRAAGTPEFVILFLPAENLLGVALQERPDLLASAFDRKVVLATPTTLMATLRSVAWAWQQAEMAEEAEAVLVAGRTLYERLSTMHNHLTRLGKSLDDAVDGYNRFLGSLDSRVMPAARRLGALAAPDGEPLPQPVEIDVRTAPRRSSA